MDFYEPVDPKRKRRWIGPVVLFGFLFALIATAAFMAEYLARDVATGIAAQPVASALGMSSTSDVDVDFGSGSLLLQIATGSIDELTVEAQRVPLGESRANITLLATGVPIDSGGVVAEMAATVRLDSAAIQSLASQLSTEPLSVTSNATTLNIESSVDIAGVATPVVLEVTPSIADGMLLFRVISITVAAEDVSIDDVLAGAYGAAAAAAATPPSMCVAQFLPSALAMTDATVRDGALELEAHGTTIALSGDEFSSPGRCATEEPAE